MNWIGWSILGWYATCSLIAAVMIAYDKRAARRGTWRISECRLHVAEWIGGWPGSLLARHLVRHKTQKLRYRVISGAALVAHVALWALLAWRIWFAE